MAGSKCGCVLPLFPFSSPSFSSVPELDASDSLRRATLLPIFQIYRRHASWDLHTIRQMKTTSTLIPLIFAASTDAHGILYQITINGKSFLGNGVDGGTPFPSVIRRVSTANPNKGANNTTLNCGPNAVRFPLKQIALILATPDSKSQSQSIKNTLVLRHGAKLASLNR